jgi:hypothetical protein
VGLIRYKTLIPEGAPHDEATLSDGPGMFGVPFQGVFFFGGGFPMALPWAGGEVPLRGVRYGGSPRWVSQESGKIDLLESRRQASRKLKEMALHGAGR